MTSLNVLLEDVIDKCGGFGRFQWTVVSLAMLSKVACAWGILMMQFGGAIPDWWCQWSNQTLFSLKYTNHSSSFESYKVCSPPQNESSFSFCSNFRFSTDMNTAVNEWELICDNDWVTSLITTIQMAGLLVSGLLAGQLSDTFGRKPTFALSLIIMVVSNLVAAFSISWEMFAVMRFLIGLGSGIYLATMYIYMIEFIPKKYRPMITAFPAFPVFAAVFGFMSWWLRDWKNLHYATSIVTSITLLSIFIIPESFRWLASRHKLDRAVSVIKKVARTNGRQVPDLTSLQDVVNESSKDSDRKFTIIDMFLHRSFLKTSCLLVFCWLSCGYSYYAITFAVDQLSGSLYLNMFLLSLVEIPGTLSSWYFNNRIGRRWTCFMLFMIAAVAGLIVAILQVVDVPEKAGLINGFALAAKLGVSAAWPALMTFTTELYPTVIRNISYGFLSSVSRVGAMVAPQLVHVNTTIPGLLYFLFGGSMLLSAVISLLFPETRGKNLEDQIQTIEVAVKEETKTEKFTKF
ncbi:solute carrier family 22 member 4-like [Saccostrea cucullata]|uniref:solute carrier family 22 member 4-like n=1 Tax=Saccostrea cuccullata TaxID=36930 RepID=UPI002ED0CE63